MTTKKDPRSRKGMVQTVTWMTKEDRAKVDDLIEAGYYNFLKDFLDEAISKHLKWTYAKLEIDEARKIIEQQDLRRRQ